MRRRILTRPFLFLSLMVMLGGLSLAARAGIPGLTDGWKVVRTEHFTFTGDAGEPHLRETARRLEEFRSAISQIYPQLKLEVPGVPTNVVIFKDAASYEPFRPLRPNGTVDDAIDGYFQPGDDANYIVTAVNRTARGDLFGPFDAGSTGVVFHEYVHFLVRTNFGEADIPPWIDEGLAEYFETFHVTGEKTAVLGLPRLGIALTLDEKTVLEPVALFATNETALRSGARAGRRAFYSEAWALVHCLLQDERAGDRYSVLSDLLSDKEAAERRVLKAFNSDGKVFGKAVLAYLNQPALPKSEVALASKITVTEPSSAVSMSEAQVNARLGDIMVHLDRRDEALRYLKQALAASPDLPSASASIGILLMRQDNFVEGRKYLEKAISAGNANPFVVFNLALAIIRGEMNANSEVGKLAPETSRRLRELLQSACDAAPEFAESRRLLALVKMVDGSDLAGAASLAKRAIELEPGNDQHRLLLARVLLRQENYSEARAAAEKLAFLSTDAGVRSEATDIIKAVDAYYAARDQTSPDKILTVFMPLPPLILKRSAVSEADIARFEEDRVINNLNRMLPRPLTGERQMVGHINRITCNVDGRVEYDVDLDGLRSILGSRDLTSLRLSVLTEGERTFKLDCGVRLSKQLTVLTVRPPKSAKPDAKPELVGVVFVPENFKLKTQDELSKARLVVVEDDTIPSSRSKRNK